MNNYRISVHQFCDEFMDEISHFDGSDVPKGKPNSINNYGISVHQFCDEFMDEISHFDGSDLPKKEAKYHE